MIESIQFCLNTRRGKATISCCGFLIAIVYTCLYGWLYFYRLADSPCCVRDGRPVECHTKGVVDVSERFSTFFYVMFLTQVISLSTSCCSLCITVITKHKSILRMFNCMSACSCTAITIIYILASVWRFNQNGQYCAGAGSLRQAWWIKLLCIIFYVNVGLICLCGLGMVIMSPNVKKAIKKSADMSMEAILDESNFP